MQHQSTTNSRSRRMLGFHQTFESSFGDHEQKFVLEKPLIKGIKANDPTKIIQNAEEGKLAEAGGIYDAEAEVSRSMVHIREQYDRMKTLSDHNSQAIQKIKKQKSLLTAKWSIYQQAKHEAQKKMMKTEDFLFHENQKVKNVIFRRDTYVNMLENLKQNIIYFRKKCFDANTYIIRNENKLKSLKESVQNYNELGKKCKRLATSVSELSKQNQLTRSRNLVSLHQVLQTKRDNETLKDTRQRHMMQSMHSAIMEKFPEQKDLIHMFHANKLTQIILRAKMMRLMKANSHLEAIFRQIKQRTDITSIQDFIERFLKRQQAYGGYLASIGKKEQILQRLKQQKNKLLLENQKLREIEEEICSRESPGKAPIESEPYLKLRELGQHLQDIQRKSELMYQWCYKFTNTFIQSETREKWKKEHPKNDLLRHFQATLKAIGLYIDQITNTETIQEEKFLKEETPLSKAAMRKNFRVKTVIESGVDTYDDKTTDEDYLSELEHFYQHRRHAIKASLRNKSLKDRFS